jgi:hypothetical protein
MWGVADNACEQDRLWGVFGNSKASCSFLAAAVKSSRHPVSVRAESKRQDRNVKIEGSGLKS